MNFVNFIFLLISYIFIVCEDKSVLSNALRFRANRSFLIGGTKVKLGDFKYVVGVVNLKESGEWDSCAGGIIDDRFVITAAHCIYDNNQLGKGPIVIYAGTNNMYSFSHHNTRLVEVEKVYVPIWDPEKETSKDIAVLRLRKSLDVENNEFLQKLRLPNSSLSENLTGEKAYVAGFGTDHLEYNVYNNTLHVLNESISYNLNSGTVRILDNAICRENGTLIDNSKLCARMLVPPSLKHYGICFGDSGSPLVYNSNILIGIAASVNSVCNERISPTIYTRVSYYTNFIKNAMNDVTDNMYYTDVKSVNS